VLYYRTRGGGVIRAERKTKAPMRLQDDAGCQKSREMFLATTCRGFVFNNGTYSFRVEDHDEENVVDILSPELSFRPCLCQ